MPGCRRPQSRRPAPLPACRGGRGDACAVSRRGERRASPGRDGAATSAPMRTAAAFRHSPPRQAWPDDPCLPSNRGPLTCRRACRSGGAWSARIVRGASANRRAGACRGCRRTSAAELLLNLPADVRAGVVERIATIGHQSVREYLHDVAEAARRPRGRARASRR